MREIDLDEFLAMPPEERLGFIEILEEELADLAEDDRLGVDQLNRLLQVQENLEDLKRIMREEGMLP